MTQKIEGKFYPLQHDEWVRACQELTPAQRDVLYFIRTLDPYGEGLEVSIAEIARQLSTNNKTVHRSTVSRALKELDAKGFVDMELLHVKVNIKAKGVHCCLQTTVLPTDNSVVYRQQARSSRNKRDHETTSVIMTQQARSPRNKREPEALPDKASNSLRSNKTYKDYIESLSEAEREKFFEFGLKKAAELPKPPALPKKWVERNWQELSAEFKKSTPADVDWSQHPRREEWIEQIRQGRPRFVAQGGPPEERETRRQFAEWAEANNLVWGDEA